jgi:GntR family transcriptional regulator, trigonelline degradation regulator
MAVTGRVNENPLAVQITRTVAPVREQVLDQLRQAIVEMRLPPGQRLVERELIEQTAVSRTTIREVLRQLEAEGLVASEPHKGTVVASVSLERAMEIYEIRATLEGMAARYFAQRASGKQLRELRRAFHAIEVAGAADRPSSAVLATKKRFYDVLLDGAANPTIQNILLSLQARVTALRALSLAQPGRGVQAIQEIRAVVEALEARDGERAAAASAEHVSMAARTVRAAIEAATTTKRDAS